jgi:hypothetical protein
VNRLYLEAGVAGNAKQDRSGADWLLFVTEGFEEDRMGLDDGAVGRKDGGRARKLEHARIYSLGSGDACELFIGSADLMPRNLDRRVEVLVPIHNPRLRRILREELLSPHLRGNVKNRRMLPDGSYARSAARLGEPRIDAQKMMLERKAEWNVPPAEDEIPV